MIDQVSYAGQRVVVTGAASGIGRATADIVHALGAEVLALDVNPPPMETAGYIETDLRDPDAIARAVDEIGSPVNALFSCAGMGGASAPMDILLCNFCGTRQLINNIVPLMPGGSSIATVSSAAGVGWREVVDDLRPLVATESFDDARRWCEQNVERVGVAYVFSKRALTFYSVLAAPRLVAKGIRINTVSPGATETGLWDKWIGRVSRETFDDALGVSGRAAAPEEQAYPLVFVNSPAASYINGIDLLVDGGRAAAKLADALSGP